MSIRIIITGGTFDKHYDELQGELTFKNTHLPEILSFVRCTLPIKLEINQLIDSLDMQLANRMRILQSFRKAPEDRIIITHGTDTMVETAQLLGETGIEKTIVLTGSMVPYTFTNSDAVFNLGCSIIGVQLLPTGVFLIMNGKVFPWNNVCKNKKTGSFEEAT